MNVDWKLWKPRLLYGGFALVAFVLSLRWTFPTEAVKERLLLEASVRGWQIELRELHPGGLLGVTARGVTLEDQAGLQVPLEQVSASLHLLPLLVGRQVLGFDAALYGGRATGKTELSGDPRHLSVTLSGIDLARALGARREPGLKLAGTLAGTAELALPARGTEKLAGRIDLTVSQAGIAGGQLPMAGMSSGFPLPALALGAISAAVKLDGGKATVEKLEARGGDAEVVTEGVSVVLQPRLELAPISGKAQLRLRPALWEKPDAAKLRPVAEAALAAARSPDGAYRYQLSGSLGDPLFRPAPGQ